VALPCAVAVAIIGWWALDAGGFAVNLWAPGGLVLLGLVTVAALVLPNRWRELPAPVVVAAGALAAYTAWSAASIAWAADPGAALEGATRTLLYLVAFCLFALWPLRGAAAGALLALWIASVAVAGLVVALRVTGTADPGALFTDGRLRAPTGYANATAALLMMPVLPAVVLSAARAVPWWGRGLAAGAAVGLASVALLTVSRGAVLGTPIAVLVLLVALPNRFRHFYALVPVVAGVALNAPLLLDVGAAVNAGRGPAALDTALLHVAVAATAVACLVAALAWLERRRGAAVASVAPVARGLAVALIAAGLLAGIVAVGNPVDRVDHAWTSFKGGYAENDQSTNRLLGGLGSARYDFYRVGLDAYRARPVLGLGADNYYARYLRDGASQETPRYPHSLEIRALAQTGLVGAVLLTLALASALLAAFRGMRQGGRLRRVTAQAATMAVVYWIVHGSADWFWEWAGLSVPAFALLGLAAGLSRAPRPAAGPAPPPRRSLRAAAVVVAGALALPLAALWVADREQRSAAAGFARDPSTAYARLRLAADLNPLAAAPEDLAGSIALRLGDLPRADAAFARALERVPTDQYAVLERGAIATSQGRQAAAVVLLARAVELAPRDELARQALAIARSGGAIDVAELNRRILDAAARLIAPAPAGPGSR
jgi:hypothetical protein